MTQETEGWIKWCKGDFIPTGRVQLELFNGQIIIRDAKDVRWNTGIVWRWRYVDEKLPVNPFESVAAAMIASPDDYKSQDSGEMSSPADKPLGSTQNGPPDRCAGITSLQHQVGGRHYLDQRIQLAEFIEANGLGYLEGAVLKRITRHNHPHGKGSEDIEKAIHELQLLKELRYEK